MNAANLTSQANKLVYQVGGWTNVLKLAGIDTLPQTSRNALNRLDVLASHLGKNRNDALATVITLCEANLKNNPIPADTNCSIPVDSDIIQRREKLIEKFLSESIGIVHTPAEKYLRSMGMKLDLSIFNTSLSYHPRMPFKRSVSSDWEYLPALLSKFVDKDGELISLNRTYLSPNGSDDNLVLKDALLASPKSELGGAVRISKPIYHANGNGVLGITKKVESALAITEGAGFPVWATLNYQLMQQVSIPENVRIVLIFVEKEPGVAAVNAFKALKAKLEAEGKMVVGYRPQTQKECMTWNQAYKEQGQNAFPQSNIVKAVSALSRGRLCQ